MHKILKKKNETKKISRRKYTAEYKAKTALVAMQESQTLPELCSKYQLSQNQINYWKKQLKERSADAFKTESGGKDDKDKLIERLYKTMGYASAWTAADAPSTTKQHLCS